MTSEDEASESVPSVRRRRPLISILAVVALVAVAIAYWFLANAKRAAAEAEAAKSLESLGVIVVMDGSRTHVASVNLSTVTSPESLAKAIELLPALTNLGSLDASRTAITDGQLATVGRLRSLESLALGQTSITDRGLKQLAGLTQLRSLNLTTTPISGAGLASLSNFRRLKILDLSATKTADNLAPLARLPQLDWLVLRNLTLADGALSDLSASESLSRLTLEGSTYPAESLTQLQQALPELSVDK
jgi:Leucine-rich repeat (LRR) protein